MCIVENIKLNYWAGHKNFGDELSPYLVEKITGKKVLYTGQKELNKLTAIGSVIDFNNIYSRSHIWGSGMLTRDFINPYRMLPLNKIFRKSYFLSKIYATRGPLTQKVLRNLGFDCPDVYGDPAILLPQYYQPKAKRSQYKFGIILHQTHKEFVPKEIGILEENSFLYISINREGSSQIEQFVDEICSCDFIFSTSLHGVIVAQAYGIPAQWLKFEGLDIHKDDSFKFDDYFLGANQETQKPLFIDALNLNSINRMKDFSFIKPLRIKGLYALLDSFPINADIYTR